MASPRYEEPNKLIRANFWLWPSIVLIPQGPLTSELPSKENMPAVTVRNAFERKPLLFKTSHKTFVLKKWTLGHLYPKYHKQSQDLSFTENYNGLIYWSLKPRIYSFILRRFRFLGTMFFTVLGRTGVVFVKRKYNQWFRRHGRERNWPTKKSQVTTLSELGMCNFRKCLLCILLQDGWFC